jgi:hypothetical protein
LQRLDFTDRRDDKLVRLEECERSCDGEYNRIGDEQPLYGDQQILACQKQVAERFFYVRVQCYEVEKYNERIVGVKKK